MPGYPFQTYSYRLGSDGDLYVIVHQLLSVVPSEATAKAIVIHMDGLDNLYSEFVVDGVKLPVMFERTDVFSKAGTVRIKYRYS